MSDRATTDVVKLARRLVDEPSENPPGEEAGVADVLRERLESSPVDFSVETTDVLPDRPNVIATAGDPSRGHVLLTGHTDVVPADPEQWTGHPYELATADGRLVGRGISDMKGSLAAKVIAAESYLSNTAEPGAVTLAFVVDEEHLGRGTQALVEDGIGAEYAILGEPSRLDVCVAQKGVVRYRVTVEGESAHSGSPDEGRNAISGVARLVDRFESLDARRRTETNHPHLTPETVTVTEIEGGTAPNVVPDVATLTVDWRTLPAEGQSPESYDETVERICSAVQSETELSIEPERTVFARGVELDSDHELVTELRASAADVDVDASAVGFNAATDARFLVHEADVPTVLFGPGSIEDDAHTVDESIDRTALSDTVATYERALERLLD